MVRLTCWAKKWNFNRNFVGFVQGSWKCKQATAKERRSVWNGGNLSHMQELWDNCWAKLGYSCCITIRGFFGEVWRGFIFWCRCLLLRICWWDFFLYITETHFIIYTLTCFIAFWELWHVHFLFPCCNMGCAKGMQSLLQCCIVAVCGCVGWAFIPAFCTAGCEEASSARSFQSHWESTALLAWVSTRSNHKIFGPLYS